MKKILAVFIIFLAFFGLIFSFESEYEIFSFDKKIGEAYLTFDEVNFTGSSLVKLSVSGADIKYYAETQYGEDWAFKRYDLDISVNGISQGKLTSLYDKEKTVSLFNNSIELGELQGKNLVILDNNFILDHFVALQRSGKIGETKFFIPQLTMNSNTFSMGILNGTFSREGETYSIVMAGLLERVIFKDGILKSIEIPAQKFKLTIKGEKTAEKKPEGFTEEEVTFYSDGFEIFGTVTIPDKGKESYPAVVLVHGSGPNDRDETIPLGNGMVYKPFLELAHGLAQKGYVVFRYDKRSYTISANKIENQDVAVDDFINDAVNSAEFIKTFGGVDSQNIFLVGHSQGASFVPMITEKFPFKGAVAIAPAMLPILDQMVYQVEYQLKYLESLNTDSGQDQNIELLNEFLPEFIKAKEAYYSGTLKEDDIILGQEAKFLIRWTELTANPVMDFQTMKTPVLIINGTEDLKCPTELLYERRSALEENPVLMIEIIGNMNHEMLDLQTIEFQEKVVEIISDYLS